MVVVARKRAMVSPDITMSDGCSVLHTIPKFSMPRLNPLIMSNMGLDLNG